MSWPFVSPIALICHALLTHPAPFLSTLPSPPAITRVQAKAELEAQAARALAAAEGRIKQAGTQAKLLALETDREW